MSTPSPDPQTSPGAALRWEVGSLRRREQRRRFGTRLHVGTLGDVPVSTDVPGSALPILDSGTRVELVGRLLEEYDGLSACAWLTRAGDPLVQDEDLAWFAAARMAFDVAGVDLDGFWSITRGGWIDVRTGERRVWKRLRI